MQIRQKQTRWDSLKKDRNDGQRIEAKILQEITYIVNIKKKNNK